MYPYNLENIYPSTKAQDIYRRVDVQLKPSYPVLEICTFPHIQPSTSLLMRDIDTPVYPYNLVNIYPPVSISERSETKDPIIVLRSSWPYPALDICEYCFPGTLLCR